MYKAWICIFLVISTIGSCSKYALLIISKSSENIQEKFSYERYINRAVKLNFRSYMRSYTSPNVHYESVVPILMNLCAFPVKIFILSHLRELLAACHLRKSDIHVCNDVKLLLTVYSKYLTRSNQRSRYKSKSISIDSLWFLCRAHMAARAVSGTLD